MNGYKIIVVLGLSFLMMVSVTQAFVWKTEVVNPDPSDPYMIGVPGSLAFDSSGNLHISFFGFGSTSGTVPTQTNTLYHSYQSDGASGKVWNYETVIQSTGPLQLPTPAITSLAFDPDGNLHISYYDWIHHDLRYASKTSSGWDIVQVDPAYDVGYAPCLAFDSRGNPHISYFDRPNGKIKYASKAGGGAWNIETVPSVGMTDNNASLALDWGGDPHISFYDSGGLRYASKSPAGWTIGDVDRVYGGNSSMAFDSSWNQPHISYYDLVNRDLRYASRTPGGWTTETVRSAGDVGEVSSLAFDPPTGKPHIAYYDSANDNLLYASKSSVGWTTETVVTGGHPWVSEGSLAIDPRGNPHIIYSSHSLNHAYTEPRPIANFDAGPLTRGFAPLKVRFRDLSTNNPTEWKWDFTNDGTIDSTEKNPKFEYNAPGLYSVSLTACNALGCGDTRIEPDYISVRSPPPPGNLNIEIDPIGPKCVGDKFTITATTNLAVGEEVYCEVFDASLGPDPIDALDPLPGAFRGASGTVKVAAGSNNLNKISFDVDASTLVPGTYLVKETAVDQYVRATTSFDVVDCLIIRLPRVDKGKIAFTSNRNGNSDIYVMNALPGSTPTQLTTDPAWDDQAAWSPNGRQITFASNRNGNWDIYVMDAVPGSTPTQLTTDPAEDSFPAWSPKGDKIAFRSLRDGKYEIYVMNADGTGTPKQLTFDPVAGMYPTWSPNGDMIAFTSGHKGNDDIYVINADGTGTPKQLTTDPMADTFPAWSPKGDKIAFMSNREGMWNSEIYVMNADGTGTPTRLTDNPAIDIDPAWSPDGKQIAFTTTRDGTMNYEIYLVNADGTGTPTRLTDNPAIDSDPTWAAYGPSPMPPRPGSPQSSDKTNTALAGISLIMGIVLVVILVKLLHKE